MRNTALALLCLTGLVFLLINSTPVQNYLVTRVTGYLSQKLKTKVEVEHVRIDLLNHIVLKGLFIEDQAHDTLMYAGEARVRMSDWFIFNNKPVLHYLSLKNTYAHLYRGKTSNIWNYDFIANAFSTSASSKKDTGKSIEFQLEKIALENVRFFFDDAWAGQDLNFIVGALDIDAKNLDFKKKTITINDIAAKNTIVDLKMYKAGKPPRKKIPNEVDTFDKTPFNEDNWGISIKTLSLAGCGFNLTMDTLVPVADLFDQNHLIIKDIKTSIKNITIVGDTIKGETLHLYAKERCGITIKEMRSNVSVSPRASICSNLYLETNHSKIHNYYAMLYNHFPDFLNYIDSVTMVGKLDNSTVDTRDIAYFAPEMKVLPAVVQVSGDGRGTVSNLYGKHLVATDGTTTVKGNLTMKGLPDIYKTYITFTDAELTTSGKGILKHAPILKDNPDIDVASVTRAFFKGNYEGFVDNFSVKGTLTTNLGDMQADVKMTIPRFNGEQATYTGSVTTDKAQFGILLRRPLLGAVSCKEDISGISFNRDKAEINMDGNISEITINNYAYHGIITHGVLGKKKFNGNLLVDDPNLALDFKGSLDYSDLKNIKINSTAHLLYSNLKALNITSDTVTTSADFDLNCTGSNIDNFMGQALLNNIDLRRNRHKVAIDSISMSSGVDNNGRKTLLIESNDIAATISGEYQLTKLPSSVEYYLSRYIPNYTGIPVSSPPDQNLDFTVTTGSIDSILAVSFVGVKGFDSSTVSGSLNTTAHKLTLDAEIPYGSIGKFHMTNIEINAEGNLDQLALNTNIDNVAIGDSFINSSLSLTTTVANDSLKFTIATTSPDTSNTLSLNGLIVGRKDSLFLSLLQSQFFLNREKWDVAGGSKVTYSPQFLEVEGISFTSALQKITAYTRLQNNDQVLFVNSENLDLAQFGSLAGLGAYQPDGRLNGTITIEKIFKQFYVSANMKATNVKLGTDTVGNITLVGYYDGLKKLLSFDPATGIYRDNSSVVASGNISFDTATNQKLDGKISFTNARVTWASPFLLGIFSRLSGNVTGDVNFSGTSDDPVLKGSLALSDAAFRLDYMGCNYTIPAATVYIDNNRISWGKLQMYDVNHNVATVSGYFSHNLFRDMQMHITATSKKIEIMKLTVNDNNLFYGNVTASMDSFTVRGPFNFIKLDAYNVAPAASSQIFIPVNMGGDFNTYSYVSFKSYGKSQDKPVHLSSYKLDLNIDAKLNNLAEVTIVLDPSTGDAITTKGEGNIQLSIPPNNDMRITGVYNIDEGKYGFNFKKILYREFSLNQGSTITFTGPFFKTEMDVNATYTKKARLYDLLSPDEIRSITDAQELSDTKTQQQVNVLLHMKGTLLSPALTFNLELPEKHSVGTYAYTKLMRMDQDDQQKLEQVGSLLLISSFIPSDGIGGTTALNGAVNNISQIISSSASVGLTTMVNRLIGDNKLNVDVKYNNYSFNDVTLGGINRNLVTVGVSHPFLDDKLTVEVGSTSDWGKPTSTSTSNTFNFTGDFRVQYALNPATNLRLNAFRTSDYDVTLDKDVTRGGVGLSWRKSFDNFDEFLHGKKYAAEQKEKTQNKQLMLDSIGRKTTGGTE